MLYLTLTSPARLLASLHLARFQLHLISMLLRLFLLAATLLPLTTSETFTTNSTSVLPFAGSSLSYLSTLPSLHLAYHSTQSGNDPPPLEDSVPVFLYPMTWYGSKQYVPAAARS
jgi:hypothetical protein